MNCHSSIITYGGLLRDETVIENQEVIIDSGLNSATPIDNVSLSFPLGASPLFWDPLQTFLEFQLSICHKDGSPVEDEYVTVVPMMASYIKSLEVWARGKNKLNFSHKFPRLKYIILSGMCIAKYQDYNYMCYIRSISQEDTPYFLSVGQTELNYPCIKGEKEVGHLEIFCFCATHKHIMLFRVPTCSSPARRILGGDSTFPEDARTPHSVNWTSLCSTLHPWCLALARTNG